MAKDDKKEKVEVKAEPLPVEVKEEPVAVPAPAKVPAVQEPFISFDRWFSSLKKPDHWKAGMRAYADTRGKKTLAAWTALFKNY